MTGPGGWPQAGPWRRRHPAREGEFRCPQTAGSPSTCLTTSTRRCLKIAGVVVLGAIMSILDITVVNVALPTLQTAFGTTGHPIAYSTVAWSVTAYTLALATVIPMTGCGRRPVRHRAPLHDRHRAVRHRFRALRDRVEHRCADRVPGPAGPGRRDADAPRHDDHDPRGRTAPDGPADGDPRRPDAARPHPRTHHRRLAHPGGELALDLPDQRPDRAARDRLRLAGPPRDTPEPSESFDFLGMALMSPGWRCSCSGCRPSPPRARPPHRGSGSRW